MNATDTPTKAVTTIKFKVNTDDLWHMEAAYLAQLWHIAQANPAPFGDVQACEFAELVGREIIRRWVCAESPVLWTHQGRHVRQARDMAQGRD